MNKIRVLIVDDSAVIRKIITKVLHQEPAIEIIGYASNGLEAIDAIEKFIPDVVTLDIEMPVMDGLSALREIRKAHKMLPVIMFSSLTKDEATAVITALTLGASECVGKPDHATGSLATLSEVIERDLVPKIIDLGRNIQLLNARSKSNELANKSAKGEAIGLVNSVPIGRKNERNISAKALCIGASTGGPMALMQIFSQIHFVPEVPIFIVQHMPATFTGLLAARLSGAGAVPVREATDGEIVESGVAYLAPGGFHMKIIKLDQGVFIRLNKEPPENNCRPAVDVLFRAAADIYADSLLALVLTGMGVDGLKGCESIVSKSGQVIVQDAETSVVWGMPGSVAQAGLADKVLPLERISAEIIRRLNPLKIA